MSVKYSIRFLENQGDERNVGEAEFETRLVEFNSVCGRKVDHDETVGTGSLGVLAQLVNAVS
jgi:hypothetical protein